MGNTEIDQENCHKCPRRFLLETQLDVFEQNVARADVMAEGLFNGDLASGQLAAEQHMSILEAKDYYLLLLRGSVIARTAARHEMLANASTNYELARQACNGIVCVLPESIRDFDERIPPNGLPSLPTAKA